MKKFKKVIALGLALALVFSSMGNVFAYPLNGHEYDGVQVGDKFYSLEYINSPTSTFGSVFGTADKTNVFFDFNKHLGRVSDYLDDAMADRLSIADYDTWAAANVPNPAAPKVVKFYPQNGIPVDVGQTELTVVGGVANAAGTSILVTFSDDSTATIQKQLTAGTHDYDFALNGKNYTVKDVTWNPPAPTELTVQEVKTIDLRHFQVVFTGKVNNISAEDPANYYFFINEGNADYMSVLPPSNQLDEIEGLTIDANDVGGKTVVDIYLPEDNRFTNIADFLPQLPSAPTAEELQQIPLYNGWYEVYGFDTQAWIDDEQTIIANRSNDVHGVNSGLWALTVGREVSVAVRNVRDLDGNRTINTVEKPMVIKDDIKPVWEYAHQVKNELIKTGASDMLVVPVYTDNSEKVRLYFSEPVFNTHGLGVGDINNTGHYKVEVAVDETKVASTEDQDLNDVLTFYMDGDDTYAEASYVDLDIKEAIERHYTDGFRADNVYKISITGITDLAGNQMTPQAVEFEVSLRDRSGSGDIVIPAPKILGVKQIHDNVFRVYLNRFDVTGEFEIRSSDGEDGLIQCSINNLPSFKVPEDEDDIWDVDDVWYKDVYVPAVDMEVTPGVGIEDNGLLAYDRQEEIQRVLRVFDVGCKFTPIQGGDSFECSFTKGNPFVIKQDIYAPVVEDADEIVLDEVGDLPGSEIILDVKDIVPNTWATDKNAAQPVYAMLYDWNKDHEFNNNDYGVFDFNSIDTAATEWYNMHDGTWFDDTVDYSKDFDLLPITVSFTKNGVKRTAIVSNRCFLNETANFPGESGRHYGAPGSIAYNFKDQQLVLDLTPGFIKAGWYKDLLDGNGRLVQGVTYEIEIPSGYFADQARFNAYNFRDWEDNEVRDSEAAWFVPNDKVLYVSDGRNNNSTEKRLFGFKGDGDESYMVHGYTSAETVVEQVVGTAPVAPVEPKDAVPQTSEEHINWFEDRNEIWVEFTGQIKTSTLTNPENYSFLDFTGPGEDVTLKDLGVTSDDIDYVTSVENPWNADNRQFAQIKLPYDTFNVDGDYEFRVAGVTNNVDGEMNPVVVRLDIDENFRPIIKEARILGNHEIELIFNESVRYTADPDYDPENLAVAAADNFVVAVGDMRFTPQSAAVGTTPEWWNDYNDPTYPLNKIVRLNVGSVEVLNTDLPIFVDIVKNENNKILIEDKNCNPLNIYAYAFQVK